MIAPPMIAIDWGTSSFRAYRLDGGGAVAERREAPLGILAVADGDFAGALEGIIGDWLDGEPGPVAMSGMIGSRQGWREVPYVPCPAGEAEIAAGTVALRWGAGRRAVILPGLTCRDVDGVPDVMRGEETQILGALDGLGEAATLCLPGTHSKFARVARGRIERFETYMTGEVFAVLRQHSILGRLMTSGAWDDAAFAEGVRRAEGERGLLHHLFGVRSRGLFGELPASGLEAYLSGLLIGHEIAAAAPEGPVAVIAGTALQRLYLTAFSLRGIAATAVAGEPAVAGLRRIAAALEGRR